LIAPGYINLAGPPSLESCTRDVYPGGLRIPLAAMLQLADGIAGAVAHLHAKGLMHGDLYAHNILWNPASGDALLSDFGAATLLPTDDTALAHAFQSLEARAFGCLLEELVRHALPDDLDDPALTGLALLASDCLAPVAEQRPTLMDVVHDLQRLRA
ncbi:MAG TPA: lipopolysaccharide kinase InaA family protein, partial [Rhodoferax sp.]|nr:lipopolysaccharide kinase InaA family protein [Rhodoferax sp.]